MWVQKCLCLCVSKFIVAMMHHSVTGLRLGGKALIQFLLWSCQCHQHYREKRWWCMLFHTSGWYLGRIWTGPHLEMGLSWDFPHLLFSNQKASLSRFPLFILYFLSPLLLFHILFLALFLPVELDSSCCSFRPSLVGQWKLLRQARISTGYAKPDPSTYRGLEGNIANYSSSHGGSCCLSPSICGHRESADRPACFYLPSISIQGDEACQGFTGTGNVSLAPGVSVV